MANPYLVIGGIAVGVATAGFGILQVPGWIAAAQDASAKNDVAQVTIGQAASLSAVGKVQSTVSAFDGSAPLGVKVTTDTNNAVSIFTGPDDVSYAVVVGSMSGKTFLRVNGGAIIELAKGVAAPADYAAAAALASTPTPTDPPVVTPPVTAAWTLNCPADVTLVMPISGAVGELVWSDGQSETVSGAPTARAIPAGTPLTAEFTGTFSTLSAASLTQDQANCFRSMDTWHEDAKTWSAYLAFKDMDNLTDVPESISSTVTNLRGTFQGAGAINSPNISKWDTRNVTDMEQTFYNATVFNQPLSGWNTGKVTSLSGMFVGTEQFNQDLNTWDTSKVKTMSGIFQFSRVFNGAIGQWDTRNVTAMDRAFADALRFDQDLSNWDTSKVKTMRSMFSGATEFTGRGVSGWNIGQVTDMSLAFSHTLKFNADLSVWNTSNVTNMTGMFWYSEAFNIDISGWNVSKVANRYNAFGEYSALTAAKMPKWVM